MTILTIDQILRNHAESKPDAIAYRFIEDENEISITYKELDHRAHRIATQLLIRKNHATRLALLLFPSGFEFIAAFFACLYADVIAVPMPIPKKARTADRFTHILNDPSFAFILTDSSTFKELQRLPLFGSLKETVWVLTDQDRNDDLLPLNGVRKEKIAFLQYTSGSTGAPKGVMISHQNIIANERMIQEAFGHTDRTVFVGWLPLFHDMGLIGNILQPMYLGIPSILMSPVAFLQKPVRWLKAISKYRATTSGAPNFAYKLCVERVSLSEMEELDLSCWEVAFNGAEPIHERTLIDFARYFERYGFNKHAFYPCYGMAEATVFVSGPNRTDPLQCMILDKQTLEHQHRAVVTSAPGYVLVGAGKTWQDGKMEVVDPSTCLPCPPCTVGEIWLQGPHIALGYWRQAEMTQHTFQAQLNDKHSERQPYLRTGDLGFIDENGHLFITGRLKDLMIIRGRNIYPQDIEILVENSDRAVRTGGCAAFSVLEDQEERLVIVAEIERESIHRLDPEKLCAHIRQLISQEFQITAGPIIFIKPGYLSKTSSGKVQRSRCKALYSSNELEGVLFSSSVLNQHIMQHDEANAIYDPQSQEEKCDGPISIAARLRDKLKELLPGGNNEIINDAPLTRYGLDSLGAISLQVFVNDTWNVVVMLEDLMEDETIHSLTDKILKQQLASGVHRLKNSQPADQSPLSYQQRGIWTELRKNENCLGYNLAKAIEILSALDVEKLRHALTLLTKRHEMLRVRFDNQEPRLTVLPQSDLPLFEADISEAELSSFFEKKALELFALHKEPPFRVWLLNTDSGRKIVFLVAHHLCADLWSLGIFLGELVQFYNHLVLPLSPPPEPLDSHYVDYIAWQQQSLNDPATADSLNFWKAQLPSDATHHVKQVTSERGDHLYFELTADLSQQLKELAQSLNTTPFTILLTAYHILISQREGSTQSCIGTTFNGRSDPRWHSTFGMFASPTAILLSLSPYRTFESCVMEVKGKVTSNLGISHLPYSYLLEKLGKSDALTLNTMFVFQQTYTLSGEFQELIVPTASDPEIFEQKHMRLKAIGWQPPISPMNLTLFMNEKKGRFFGYFEYKTSLFSPEAIESLRSTFIDILQACLIDPKIHIGALTSNRKSVLTSAEAQCPHIIEKFQSIVKEKGHQCALVHGFEHLSYDKLEAESNRFARLLARKGVKPDTLVAIMLPHSKEVVIALLAILKIGAAFLPIHPQTPPHRLHATLLDSGCLLLISQEPDPHSPVPLLTFEETDQESDAPFAPLGDSRSVAYVIYTSGSTGKPKGVAIAQYSLMNYLSAIKQDYGMEGTLHFSLHSSLAFDLTLTSLFFPLLYGHTLHIYPEQIDIDATFASIFSHPLLTHVKLTPSHLKLIEHLPVASSPIVQLIVGGEQLSLALAKKACKQIGRHISIINEYGPTEATIGCIYFPYSDSQNHSTAILPIGQPLGGTRAYLLNEYFQEMNEGIAASLYLGGQGLAYGYWNQPGLTAEKFLPDPHIESERIYKTGDLAKKERSLFYCLGRDDRQVKLRGFRFELDEVEGYLQQYPGIHQCIVLLRTLGDQDQILCAYVVGSEDSTLDEEHLRSFLHARLPYYMVPALFIFCAAMPLTINGKIDVKALPDPHGKLAQSSSHQKPKTTLQLQLAHLWAKVLGIKADDISITQAFFELGGDSIKAIQLAARAKDERLFFTVADLFNYPTIERLSLHMSSKAPQLSKQVDSPDHNNPIPLAPIQKWFFHHFHSHTNHYNQSVILHSDKGFKVEQIKQAFHAIVEHHESLRTFFPDRSAGLIKPSTEASFSIDIVDLSRDENWQIGRLATMREIQKGLCIESGPLMRLAVISTPQGDDLGIAIHHLVVDGISWRILLADLDRVLDQLHQGQSPALPEKTESYRTWVERSSHFEIAQSRESFKVGNQVTHGFTFSHNTCDDWLTKVNHPYRTNLQDILLAALYATIASEQKIQSITLHLEGHGRTYDLDLSRTIGWFTSLSRIMLDIPTPDNLSHLIKAVKVSAREECPSESHPTLCFNYLGQFSTSEHCNFTYTPHLIDTLHPDCGIPYDLQCMAWVSDKRLEGRLIFDCLRYPANEREQFIQKFQSCLNSLINHCLERTSVEYTPSDFSLVNCSWIDWGKLQTQISLQHPDGMESVDRIYPLSPLQEGLLYHAISHPDDSFYHEQAVLEIEGHLNEEYVQKSIDQLVLTYESLRTGFFYDGLASPKQVVFKHVHVPFTTEHMELDHYLQTDRKRSFNVSSPSLLRVAQLKQADNRSILVWSFHHLIVDGWSLSLLFNSFLHHLKLLYEGKSLSHPSSITLMPYVQWQQDQNRAVAGAYWKKLLAGAELTALPKLETSHETTAAAPRKLKRVLPSELISALERVGRDSNLTLNSLLQGVWGLLLSHYTQNENVVFGTVIAGRNPEVEGIENIVGLFIQTIPVRLTISGHDTIIDLARSVTHQFIESEKHSTISLSEIQSQSELKNHLFDHLFIFENYPFAGLAKQQVEEAGLPFKVTNADLKEETHYGLTVSILPGACLSIEFQYDSEKYAPSWIQGVSDAFEHCLLQATLNPQIAVRDLVLASPSEIEFLEIFNRTASHFSQDNTIIDLFEDQVTKSPDSIALIFGNTHLTYRELATRSEKLARHLASIGIGPEKGVMIHLEKSPELVIAWLAVLKAGGFYIPLDPSFAVERIMMIYEESLPDVILTSSHLAGKLPTLSCTTLLMDTLHGKQEFNCACPLTKADPLNLAYVLYTSGSTGRPKGIAMSHRAVRNHAEWTIRRFHLCATDRMLQLTSFSFDVSVCELHILLVGGTLVLPSSHATHNAHELLNTIQTSRVTFLQFVPSLLEVLLKPEAMDKLSTVRQVLCGAEALKREDLAKWMQMSHIPITNLYGLTETCVDATAFDCQSIGSRQCVPIGKPISNVETYVLDKYLNRIPREVQGELYIGGEGVARGYYNRAALTAEKFIPHPFKSGERVFKTQDRVLVHHDGELQFKGRTDSQVKIRGYRIELGEIETIIQQYSQDGPIDQVVLKIIESDSGLGLCAYITAGNSLNFTYLKIFLQQRLPSYMVPSFFVQLEAFPINTNGKIDIHQLPPPIRHSEPGMTATRSEIEHKLEKLWQDVLHLQRPLSIDQNFFDLGGNSMSIMQVHYQISEVFGKKISIEQLFQYPTIRTLGEFITQQSGPDINLEAIAQRIELQHQRRTRHTRAENTQQTEVQL